MQFTLLNYGKATILTANEVNNEAELILVWLPLNY